MKKIMWSICALLCLNVVVPLHAAPSDRPGKDIVSNADADRQVTAFFTTLKAGKAPEAIDGLFKASPLMNGRTAEKQQLVSQTESAIKIYGNVTNFELVESDALGSMFIKRYYIVQHENLLTRWEFDFARLPSGWVPIYYGFNDQAQSWL